MLLRLLLCAFFFIFSTNSQISNDLNNNFETQQLITDIHLGNKTNKNVIYIYIAPSCLHCARFIIEDLEKFLDKNENNRHIIIKLLPASAKDIFIIKLLNNETQDENLFFLIFKNYIKRILTTINQISPTDEEQLLFKGSKKDPEMIKFQVGAHEFGFSEDKIQKAYPIMKGKFELSLLNDYLKTIKYLSSISDSKEINLPLIINKDKVYKNLYDIKN